MIELATETGLLSPISNRFSKLCCSLYADDAALFINPTKEDLETVAEILDLFGKASGLVTNRLKSAAYPIRCEGLDLDEILEGFSCPVQTFPCTYLGLPLHYKQLRRVNFQPLIDKMANRLPLWKGKFLNRAGRLKLLNTSLSTIPTYLLTLFAPKKWLPKRLNKFRHGFLWKGSEDAHGGHCLVMWRKVQNPKLLGGLGVLDLELFSRALRLRWLWYEWKEKDRPWVGSDVPFNEADKQLFRVCTSVTLGNRKTTKFWESSWLDGKAPRDLAPNLYKLAWRKNQTVADDLHDGNWMRGMWRTSSSHEMAEFMLLWPLV
jgi:mannosylglycoprotein endo-beta-mannosidase